MLRGYIVAARDKIQHQGSYIWDVSDPTGKRVNRITGEEVVATVNPKDPWASVTPQVTQSIADKTAASLGSWLPNQASAAVASGVVRRRALRRRRRPEPGAVQSASAIRRHRARARRRAQPPSRARPPPALPRSERGGCLVPPLPAHRATATRPSPARCRASCRGRALSADRPGERRLSVEGKVIVGAAKEGKQSIQIDWRVKDPQGKALGTVSQKNEIPQGSLDGAWGKTADAAAAAAAQGILKLLPQPKSTN